VDVFSIWLDDCEAAKANGTDEPAPGRPAKRAREEPLDPDDDDFDVRRAPKVRATGYNDPEDDEDLPDAL
jgi:hypothetical protein